MCSSRIESDDEWSRNFQLELEWICFDNSRTQTVAGIINHVSWIKSAKGSPANDLNWPLNYMTPCQYDSIWAFDERAHLLPICLGSKRLRVVQKMRNQPVWGRALTSNEVLKEPNSEKFQTVRYFHSFPALYCNKLNVLWSLIVRMGFSRAFSNLEIPWKWHEDTQYGDIGIILPKFWRAYDTFNQLNFS